MELILCIICIKHYQILNYQSVKNSSCLILLSDLFFVMLGVWGYCKADDIERVHTRFCRSILGVKRSTNTSVLYLELDRKPLIAFRQLEMLNYWVKVIRTDDPLLHSTYSMLRQDADQGNTYNNLNWAFHVKTTLDQLGFSNVWLDQDNLAGIPMPQIRQSKKISKDQELIQIDPTSCPQNQKGNN